MASEDEPNLARLERMITALARRVRSRYREAPLDDLMSVGREAALRASRSFDPTRGVPLELFALKRVKGAMIRYACGEAFSLAPLRRAIERRLLDADFTPPADVPLEVAMTDTPEIVRKRAVVWARKQMVAMAATALIQDARLQTNPVERRDEYTRAHAVLADLIERLPEAERTLIEVHYRGGGTLAEVAERLGISRRTALRLHEKLKERLAAQLRGKGVNDAPEPLSSRG